MHFDCRGNGTTSRHLLYVAKLTHRHVYKVITLVVTTPLGYMVGRGAVCWKSFVDMQAIEAKFELCENFYHAIWIQMFSSKW